MSYSKSQLRKDNPDKAYKVLVADLIGLKFDEHGKPDHSEVERHIGLSGGIFHNGLCEDDSDLEKGKIHFFYQPDLSREDELLPITKDGQYDATIVAATFLPEGSKFIEGGVRIGAGTGNMGSASWGGGNGNGGPAPLMNTPSFNSRATAQMAMKAMLKVLPDIDVEELHERVCKKDFDTGKNLCEYPTEKVEGKTIAVLGFGNIGREVACLAKAFGMNVNVYARPHHKEWIHSEGFNYFASPAEAAKNADVLSPHTGLGAFDPDTGKFANDSVVNSDVLNAMNDGAIVINYDRGEVINADALDQAMSSGKIRYAAIDADLFQDSETGEISGPMVPYLGLQEKHPDKFELLPHAAADTEHVSRVEGAKQAVDQIMQCIQYRSVMNLKGDLPEGYEDAGSVTVNGVGKVTPNKLMRAISNETLLEDIRTQASSISSIWEAISNASEAEREQLIERNAAKLIKSSNHYITLIEQSGLKGPYG